MAGPLNRCGLQTSRSHIGAVLLHRNPYQWCYLPVACYLYTPSMTAHSAGVWLCVQVPQPASVDHQAARSRSVTRPFLEHFACLRRPLNILLSLQGLMHAPPLQNTAPLRSSMLLNNKRQDGERSSRSTEPLPSLVDLIHPE